jgi:very-short-patch-repair endonuclease
VAASRARDQLWLVHCLEPRRDLHPSDLRRRLIEHVRAGAALRRHAVSGPRRAPSPLEGAVFERLVREGFRTEVQVPVGGYRIDLVVYGSKQQVAIACDGDRFQSIDRIPEEMAQQAVLERVGWRFRRIRGTRFYRDPEGTMDGVFTDLRRLGVEPMRSDGDKTVRIDLGENLENKIVRRAWQIMRGQDWVQDEPGKSPPPLPPPRSDRSPEILEPLSDSAITELVLDETTEPHFVILEQKDDG